MLLASLKTHLKTCFSFSLQDTLTSDLRLWWNRPWPAEPRNGKFRTLLRSKMSRAWLFCMLQNDFCTTEKNRAEDEDQFSTSRNISVICVHCKRNYLREKEVQSNANYYLTSLIFVLRKNRTRREYCSFFYEFF